MSGPTARRWVAVGRVQGVGFRWYIRGRAEALGARGWVRNLPDGSVEVVAAAASGTLDELEEIVRRGPPGARVEALRASDIPHEHVDTKSFEIKR